jgi:hypothetical protein
MSLEIITHIVKSRKVKNFKKLEELVLRCYSLRLESIKEIDDYFDSEAKMFDVAKKLVKKLGLWYDDLSMVVDTYITNWLQLGFDEDALLKLAEYSFKTSVRTLDGFDKVVNNMFRLSVISSRDIDNYIEDIVRNDNTIRQILESLGINREVNVNDRSLYKTWIYSWKLNDEIIKYVCTLCDGKYLPMQYLNKLLSECNSNNLTTIDMVKKHKFLNTLEVVKKTNKEAKKREYSKKELDSLFDDIQEIEI